VTTPPSKERDRACRCQLLLGSTTPISRKPNWLDTRGRPGQRQADGYSQSCVARSAASPRHQRLHEVDQQGLATVNPDLHLGASGAARTSAHPHQGGADGVRWSQAWTATVGRAAAWRTLELSPSDRSALAPSPQTPQSVPQPGIYRRTAQALFCAAAAALAAIPLTWPGSCRTAGRNDLAPSMHWPAPIVTDRRDKTKGRCL